MLERKRWCSTVCTGVEKLDPTLEERSTKTACFKAVAGEGVIVSEVDGIGCCNESSPAELFDATVQGRSSDSFCGKARVGEGLREVEDDGCCCCKKSGDGVE